jgi:hypothetical protein
MKTPWYAALILLRPRPVLANLERVRAAGGPALTPWQLSLAVLRMWHRILLRPETVGTSRSGRPRPTWRARALHHRALRLPFLLAEGAVVPFDLTGLASSPERLIRHLLGAYHDERQFAFDLEILALHGRLADLERAAREVVAHDTRRSRWLRDLAVFEGYHESLLAAVERALAGHPILAGEEADDPDVSFAATLRWCARQPATPSATVRALLSGRFREPAA